MTKELQQRENDLRRQLEAELGPSSMDLVQELVEVNIELEQLSNQ